MGRKKKRIERPVQPDPVYGEPLVTRFVNKMMWHGKKSTAYRIFYDAMEVIKKRLKTDDPIAVFKKAIDNVKPEVEVRSRRVGGATYQVPVEVRPERQMSLAMKWIIQFARARKGKPMAEKLAAEIIDAYNNTGASIKKRDDTHKMAEANKAFSHFRW